VAAGPRDACELIVFEAVVDPAGDTAEAGSDDHSRHEIPLRRASAITQPSSSRRAYGIGLMSTPWTQPLSRGWDHRLYRASPRRLKMAEGFDQYVASPLERGGTDADPALI
jgi:hypothetical protein